MRAQSLVLRGLIAAVLVAGGPSPVAAGADAGVFDEQARCEATFVVAEAIRLALDATGPVGDAPWDHRSALLDLTIRSCAHSVPWLAAAALHPALLDGADPDATLTARCADPAAGLAATPVCVDVPEAELVARPKVQPRVKGAQRTRYYQIRGLSPDELFTQMQVNGSQLCPTHAVACVNIQPVLRPLVTRGANCRVVGIQASLRTQAALPRWVGPARVYRPLVAWWRKVANRIGRHEQQHIRIAERHLARLRREIIGRPCSSLNAFVNRWSSGVTEAQNAFDVREQRRPWPEYDGPVP
jgi:predicted secreted Zn-dependent protease